jgi:phosphoribosylaminoimidazole carboxylase PurE protein
MGTRMDGLPKIGIVLGSESDLKVMILATEVLRDFGVPFEMIISSAHRHPEKTINYAKSAKDRGLKVLIAGAGMAAHLAGVLASSTILPVIGVPLQSSVLEGLDALFSTVQMPSGVPVATVAVNGAKNAAYLAIQILSLEDNELAAKLIDFKEKLINEVESKNQKLQATLKDNA